jgi:arylsulfatase A-like enzyme
MKQIIFKRRLQIVIVILIIIFSSCSPSKKSVKKPQNNPNIIFIVVDDLSYWPFNKNIQKSSITPNIDRLSSEGVFFTNAYCQSPLSGPSRASLFTGLRPSTSGIYGMIKDDSIKKDSPITKDEIFLPEYFRKNGYYTMGIGKIFDEHAPKGIFDESGGRVPGFGPLPQNRFVWKNYSPKEGYGSTGTDWGAFPDVDSLMPDYQSAKWVIDRLNRNYNTPFFLAVGFLRPHVPWYVPKKWFELHPLENIATPPFLAADLNDVPDIALQINDLPMMPTTSWAINSGEWPKIIQAYLACVSFVDYYIGEIFDALKNSKYAENTVVVLCSDNGYRLGEKGTFAKQCLWEEATKVSLIFAGTDIEKGKTINSPVELLSIYPTLLDLCGLNPYNRNEGANLAPLLRQGKANFNQKWALTTYGWGNHALRTENYR